jgi:hypothetical protein
VADEDSKMEYGIPAVRLPKPGRRARVIAYVVTAIVNSAFLIGLQANELLQIQGKARRYYTIIHVENIELYTPQKLSYNQILSGNQHCMIKCIYLVYAPVPYYQSKWKTQLIEAGASEASADAFLARLPKSVNSGDILELEWVKDTGLSITFNGQPAGRLNDVAIFQSVFNTFLGRHAPPGMAADLIGSAS